MWLFGRGIVEGDVGVLPDADQAQIDGFDRQGLPQPLELARKLGFAVDQRHLFELHLVNKSALEVFAEARGMGLGQRDIFVKMEHFHPGPVDIALQERVKQFKLGSARGKDDARLSFLPDGFPDHLRAQLCGGGSQFLRCFSDYNFHH